MSEASAESQAESNDRLPGFREGCLFWLGFTLIALVIRGVRWDENYEFAQAMTGLVPYDDAHPLRQYTLAAYNLQFYSSALILLISENPIWLNGFRNMLFIACTVLPPFMLGTWLSRNAWIGHATAVFVLLGVHLEFDGAYPQFIWPGMFSNGHVGVGYMLIFAGCLAAGHVRCAGLLLGLAPAIHLGQIPPALALAGLYAIRCVYMKDYAPLKNAVVYFGVGILCCIVFYAIQQRFALPPVTDGPYYSDADARAIWQGRIVSHDMHRQIPYGNVHIVTVATLLIGWVGGFRLRSDKSALMSCWLWLTVYATCVIATTYAIMAAHYLLGPDVPYLLLGWLPYRLLNHLPPILIVMALTTLAGIKKPDDSFNVISVFFVGACLVFAVCKPILPHLLGDDLYSRYFFHNDLLLFALIGATAGVLSVREKRAVALFLIAWAWLAFVHRYGAAITLASALLAVALIRNGSSSLFSFSRMATVPIVIVVLTAILWPESRNRTHLPVGEFEASTATLLHDRGDGDALIVAHPQQVLLQAQTGHPVFADMATEFHASYRPSLGPSVQAMYDDVYGIWFEERLFPPPGWQAAWTARTPEQWAGIRDRWNIEYLIAPSTVEIQLEPLLTGDLDTLYALPE